MYQASSFKDPQLNREFIRIEEDLKGEQDYSFLRELNVEPDKPRDGMIIRADGSNWNPGYGAGLYLYNSGWVKLIELTAGTLNLPKLTAAPAGVDGRIAYADGTSWNPGGGEGIYAYYGAAWNKL